MLAQALFSCSQIGVVDLPESHPLSNRSLVNEILPWNPRRDRGHCKACATQTPLTTLGCLFLPGL
jgi:hypothetical protein